MPSPGPLPKPAVFLDRDGTLIEDCGDLSSPSQVIFFEETVAALKRLQDRFELFMVTHQPAVSMGRLQPDDVERVNTHVVETLRRQGIVIRAVYCCPHQRSENCDCIKPKPFFARAAATDYNLDLSRSFSVGDHLHDALLADNVGGQGIIVMTGHGRRHRDGIPSGVPCVPGIREAADWILAAAAMQRLESESAGEIARAAAILRDGGLVAFPTETVYGLGAVAFNPTAVARIFDAKQRPRFDPLIVHVADPASVRDLVDHLPDAAGALIDHFWPGPLTLVLPKADAVPDLVTAGLPSVAVRMPCHPLALALIRQTGTPLAAPSANRFGQTSPTCAAHVRDGLGDRVDGILDGGPCSIGVESTIIGLTDDRPVLLRPGGIPIESIESITGPVQSPGDESPGPVTAPGMLPRHYAPRTPLRLCDRIVPPPNDPASRIGALVYQGDSEPRGFAAVEILSARGDLREAATNLFSAIRRLDALGLDAIVAQRVPDHGLGRAINDRLVRAAAPAG